jgi:hypothetical protein
MFGSLYFGPSHQAVTPFSIIRPFPQETPPDFVHALNCPCFWGKSCEEVYWHWGEDRVNKLWAVPLCSGTCPSMWLAASPFCQWPVGCQLFSVMWSWAVTLSKCKERPCIGSESLELLPPSQFPRIWLGIVHIYPYLWPGPMPCRTTPRLLPHPLLGLPLNCTMDEQRCVVSIKTAT